MFIALSWFLSDLVGVKAVLAKAAKVGLTFFSSLLFI